MAQAAAAAAPPPPEAPPPGDTYRDHHGFLVKPEFSALYSRFAPIYEAEERERSEKWAELMGELATLVGRQGRGASSGTRGHDLIRRCFQAGLMVCTWFPPCFQAAC